MSVGKKLRLLREEAGLSVREVAQSLKMAPSSYKHYEDRYKKPTLKPEFVEKLAPVLEAKGISVDRVFDLTKVPDTLSNAHIKRDVIEINIENDRVFVTAECTAKGVDELIRRLTLTKSILDPKSH